MATEHKGLRRPEAGVYVAYRRVASISLVLLWALRDSPEGGVMSIKTYLTTRPWRRYMYIWLKARIPEFQCKKKKKKKIGDQPRTLFFSFLVYSIEYGDLLCTQVRLMSHIQQRMQRKRSESPVLTITWRLTVAHSTVCHIEATGRKEKRKKKGPVFRENSKDWNVSQASSPVM